MQESNRKVIMHTDKDGILQLLKTSIIERTGPGDAMTLQKQLYCAAWAFQDEQSVTDGVIGFKEQWIIVAPSH